MTTIFTLLQEILTARLSQPQSAWLEHALARIGEADDAENTLLKFSAMAARKLGSASLDGEAPSLPVQGGAMSIAHWTCAEVGRVLLALSASAAHPEQDSQLVEQVFRQGDEAEVGAVTRGLVLFEQPSRFKALALEVGRTNSKTLYSCLLDHNPYPAMFYSDHEFNQLVLKALFSGLPITAVQGLQTRANTELSRMCEDYIDERLAAGRSIPVDIWLALGPCASAYGEQLLHAYAKSEDPQHRQFASLALDSKRSC